MLIATFINYEDLYDHINLLPTVFKYFIKEKLKKKQLPRVLLLDNLKIVKDPYVRTFKQHQNV